MRIGRLPLVPYYRPGDRALAEAVREKARKHHAVLLANHGPVVAGKSVEDAVYNAEEMEQTAKLFLLLSGRDTRLLEPTQIADLETSFPS
jgi:ribulose-5-phosphate 4-epimerase/fuculose-1-phosphate aldolase